MWTDMDRAAGYTWEADAARPKTPGLRDLTLNLGKTLGFGPSNPPRDIFGSPTSGPHGHHMPSHFLFASALAVATGLMASCSSTPDSPAGMNGIANGTAEAEPYVRTQAEERATGLALADLDRSIRAWNTLVLTGNEAKDGPRMGYLEEAIAHKAKAKIEVLIDQLETGPLVNRRIAATALGFSGKDDALSPLLNALEDTDDQVVANALLGLSILGNPKTPVGGVTRLFSDRDQTIEIRNNAGRTLRATSPNSLDEGGRSLVIESARAAIGDEEPSVVVYAMLLLAELKDTESLERISLRLDDPSPLVGRAASRAVAYIGSVDDRSKGPATRALVASLKRVDPRSVRPAVYRDLQNLSQVNYGDDVDAWIRYAANLP